MPFRDKYVLGGEMWVTESGDAGGGADIWASTYMDVLRTLNELGENDALPCLCGEPTGAGTFAFFVL